MALPELAAAVVHQVVAAVWVGSVVFVTAAVLPLAREGDVGTGPLASVVGTLQTVSRTSALLLVLTGAYLLYAVTLEGTLDASVLLETREGWLVLAMVALFLVLAATVEIGAARLDDGLDADKLREPAREARPWLLVASAAGLLVAGVAGLLSRGAWG